jgi:hypothetical protein
MATVDMTQDTTGTAAQTAISSHDVQYKTFSFSKGSAPATADVFQIWDIPARCRILWLAAQAVDLADGNSMVGDDDDTDRFLDVADASAAVTTVDGVGGMGYLYTSADTLDVTMGTLTTATDVTFTIQIQFVMDYGDHTS